MRPITWDDLAGLDPSWDDLAASGVTYDDLRAAGDPRYVDLLPETLAGDVDGDVSDVSEST